MVGLGGLEPPSPPWKGSVADQLDYNPVHAYFQPHDK